MEQNINKDSQAHLERIKLIQEGEGSYRQDSRDKERDKCRLWFLKKLVNGMLTSNWGSNCIIMVMEKTINQRNEPELKCF